MRNSLASIFILMLNALTSQSQTQIPAGVVRGTVVNEDGKPVAGATVWAHASDVAGHVFQKTFLADSAGGFTIPYLEWGQYRVFAIKESDGYADLHWALHDNGKVPVVNISATAPIAEVQVRVGPKAAVLTGSITDAVTGVPVPNATFLIWRWTDGADRTS